MKNRHASLAAVPFVVLAVTCGLSATANPAPDFDAAFSRLKNLVGTWDVEGADRTVTYSLTGDDETIIEDFTGEPTMSTFYHRDGDALRLTHYCNAGNQPRMRAVAYDAEKGVLNFEFVDVTNLSAPTAYHTRDLEIRFVDKNHIVLEFTGMKNGETSASPVSLTRRSR